MNLQALKENAFVVKTLTFKMRRFLIIFKTSLFESNKRKATPHVENLKEFQNLLI
jgi:hypothetical protein